MPRYRRDVISRLEDIEGLLVMAQGLASRLSDEELQITKTCIGNALNELRGAQRELTVKWSEQDAG